MIMGPSVRVWNQRLKFQHRAKLCQDGRLRMCTITGSPGSVHSSTTVLPRPQMCIAAFA